MATRTPLRMPRSLAQRFALAAAGLAAGALLLAALGTWWLIDRQQRDALRQLSAKELQYSVVRVGSDLQALASRMAEVADSTILATGLVDSAGRETYLTPFLESIRQINGLPVQLLLADFEGQTISANGPVRFTPEQKAWLRDALRRGQPDAMVFDGLAGHELVALQPMVYSRTASPEGAIFYKVRLEDLSLAQGLRLEWGPPASPREVEPWRVAAVPVPPAFADVGLRVRTLPGAAAPRPSPQYLPMLGLALVLFAAVALAGRRLAGLLTRDLERLAAFASRFIGSGLSHERAPVSGSGEVANLARSINQMLDRLHEQHAALEGEREKLQQLTEALRAADRRKDDFLAMLAHELRNPLAPIRSGAELLQRTPGADPLVRQQSEVIVRQARHMTEIVDDLLDVSRVTRGLIELDRADIDLAEVVQAAVEQARPLIAARGHALAVQLPDTPLPVHGDRARLVQVISNLLNNACKYTPEGGHIVLQVQAQARSIVLSVQDDGQGIPAELMPALFELFTQGSRTPERAQGGLGLGLALVRQLVELHGGSVQAHSDGPGRGARFTVTLPRAAAAVAQRLSPAMPATPATAATPAREQHHQVLLVDDNLDAAESLAALLMLDGHDVTLAADGRGALAAARSRDDGGPPPVCILDIGLPGMDGCELARRLRDLPQGRTSLLIALTGYGQKADRDRSIAAGFDHHLVKPVDAQALATLLRRWSPTLRTHSAGAAAAAD